MINGRCFKGAETKDLSLREDKMIYELNVFNDVPQTKMNNQFLRQTLALLFWLIVTERVPT